LETLCFQFVFQTLC